MRAQSVQRRSVFLKTIRLARCRLVHGATEITALFQPSKSRNFSGYLSRLRASSSRDGRARSSLARPDGGGGASSCAARYASTGGAFGSAHSLGCSNVHHSALAVVSSREHLRTERETTVADPLRCRHVGGALGLNLGLGMCASLPVAPPRELPTTASALSSVSAAPYIDPLT